MKSTATVITCGRYGIMGLVAFWLAACSTASGVMFSENTVPPRGKSVIYVYRDVGILGNAGSFELFANGHLVTDVTNGGYYDFIVEPGPVELRTRGDLRAVNLVGNALERYVAGATPVITFQAAPDQVYYFKFKVGGGVAQERRDEAVKGMTDLQRFDDPKPGQ